MLQIGNREKKTQESKVKKHQMTVKTSRNFLHHWVIDKAITIVPYSPLIKYLT